MLLALAVALAVLVAHVHENGEQGEHSEMGLNYTV
jgi:hypothetical protein